nr:TetR/AcrR family transcriptional regulator [Mesorhizobium amorphae]
MTKESVLSSSVARKRAEIVAIARQLFFQAGYAGTSMSQIAAAVGGSKTTLYNHFQSKEQLLLAVVDSVVEAGGSVYDTSVEPSEFRAWLAWFGVATVKRITSPDYISLQRLAAAEALRFPDIGKAFDDASRRDIAWPPVFSPTQWTPPCCVAPTRRSQSSSFWKCAPDGFSGARSGTSSRRRANPRSNRV